MIKDMNTRLLVSKYSKHKYEDVEEELIELLEHKDERFRKMGMYFEEERNETLKREFANLIQ